MKNTIKIFTDGCCIGNPGVGGWAAIMLYGKYRKEISGVDSDTTNNRMELTAVIESLKTIKKEKIPIEVFTDSKYVRDGITVWIEKWRSNNWKTSKKKSVKNQDLWRALDKLRIKLNPVFNWIPGHMGIPENENADALANKVAREWIKER